MRYRSGGSDDGRRRDGGRRSGDAAERAASPRRDADGTQGDACATRLVESLCDAVLALDTHPAGFEEAARKADHVEALRRVLGILLDVLADWEMLAGREGR